MIPGPADPHEAPGLYIHIPFCASLCPYCDFAVLKGGEESHNRYLAHLLREMEMASKRPELDGLPPFDTLYFGGGSPSQLQPEQIKEIKDKAWRLFALSRDTWITLEANPEDVTERRLQAWRALGVKTLSLGVQTYDPDSRAFLGRSGDPRSAVRLAREAGFASLAMDLIYGLPDQAPADWREDLRQAVEAGPDHLSCYQLTIHPGTPFGFRKKRGELHELPDEGKAELFRLTHDFLAESGYLPYEVSSFARGQEHQSRHNKKYWHHLPYLGLGLSAHSFMGKKRWWNVRKIKAYGKALDEGRLPVDEEETLGPEDLALEALMLGFRTTAGVDLARINEQFGIDLLPRNERLIHWLQEEALVTADGSRLIPTLDGLSVADSLAREFEIPAMTGPES